MRSPAKWATTGCLSSLVGLLLLVSIRPGFLALDQPSGWVALLGIVGSAGLLGLLLSAVLRALGKKSSDSSWSRRQLLVWGLIILSLLALSLRGRMVASPDATKTRVMVLGFDGATWSVIDRLIGERELPNFSRLKNQGATGILLSDEPTLSPRVWTTLATGVGPEVHGAEDFFSTQESILVPRIWEVVSAYGDPVGVWEWLLTWPPGDIDGFVVPGWLTRGVETCRRTWSSSRN